MHGVYNQLGDLRDILRENKTDLRRTRTNVSTNIHSTEPRCDATGTEYAMIPTDSVAGPRDSIFYLNDTRGTFDLFQGLCQLSKSLVLKHLQTKFVVLPRLY